MNKYRELVWKESGFAFEKSDLFDDDSQNEVFFQGGKLEEAINNCYTKTEAWFNKYTEYRTFRDEYEALEDALDSCEDDKELEILMKRDKELKQKGEL